MSLSRWVSRPRSDFAWALLLVLVGSLLGLVVNAYSPHGINMALAMDWWPQ